MAERNAVKARKCRTCGQVLQFTAKGMREHGDACLKVKQ